MLVSLTEEQKLDNLLENVIPISDSMYSIIQQIPLVYNESEGYSIVNYNDLDNLNTQFYSNIDNSINLIAESNNIDPNSIIVCVNEADLIEFPEIVNELSGINYVVDPIPMDNPTVQLCDYLVEEALETGDDYYLDILGEADYYTLEEMFFQESDVKTRALVPIGSRALVNSSGGALVPRGSRALVPKDPGALVVRGSRALVPKNSGGALVPRGSRSIILKDPGALVPRGSRALVPKNSGGALVPRGSRAIIPKDPGALVVRGSRALVSLGNKAGKFTNNTGKKALNLAGKGLNLFGKLKNARIPSGVKGGIKKGLNGVRNGAIDAGIVAGGALLYKNRNSIINRIKGLRAKSDQLEQRMQTAPTEQKGLIRRMIDKIKAIIQKLINKLRGK